MPSLDEMVEYMKDCSDWMSNASTKAPEPYTVFINNINGYLKGRVLAITAEGQPVLAPLTT